MPKLIWIAVAGLILSGSILSTLLGLSPSNHPSTVYLVPLTVGWLAASLYAAGGSMITTNRYGRWTLAVARQSLIFGLVTGVLLYLQGLRVISAVDVGLMLGAALMLELFFQAEKTDQRSPGHET